MKWFYKYLHLYVGTGGYILRVDTKLTTDVCYSFHTQQLVTTQAHPRSDFLKIKKGKDYESIISRKSKPSGKP
jgi:hypothetical protein